MDFNNENYADFKQEFWEWFDSLPLHKKQMFWRYKEDMAETNFYFAVYLRKKND